ncbi:hypothetical protein HOO54_20920 [Bacillus sp. WMMC1349]|uniref:hypothetical protein n=1 Tax=Bacillus sp. WMMC1349 TaxID=2736254 RepID=UPI001553FF1D|nr:hypothetical protein [Bacillus sp. WMMC1349]NPC94621.1 hypothetical protein [Bacillus sp. WMMC1349]
MFKTKFKKTVGMVIITVACFIFALPANAYTKYVWIRDVPEFRDAFQYEYNPATQEVSVYWKNADGTTRGPQIVKCDKVQDGKCYLAVEVN